MLSRGFLTLCLLSLLLLTPLVKASNQVLLQDSNADSILLQPYLYHWTGQNQNLDHIKDNISFFSFWQSAEDGSRIDFSGRKPEHLMFSIQNMGSNTKELVLVHPQTSLDRIKLIYLLEGNIIAEYQAGNRMPFGNRPIPHRQFVFPMTLKAGETITVLIEAEGRMDNFFREFSVWDRQSFFERTDTGLIVLSIYFTFLFLLIIYSLVLYSTAREMSYLWFTLSIVALLIRSLTMNNMFFEFVWPNHPGLQNSVLILSVMASSALTALFAMAYLPITKHMPRLYRTYRIYLLLHIPAIFYQAYSGWSLHSMSMWLLFVGAPFAVFIWSSTLFFYKQGNKNAQVFLLCYSILLISGFISAGNQFFNFNLPFLNPVEDIGQTLEIIIFTVALSLSIGSSRERTHIAFAKNKAKSDFLAKMSHEIRTPINGVLGMAQLLSETPLSRKQQHYADVINHCSKTLLNVINDILEYSKIEAGKLEFEHTPFNLDELLLNNNALFWPQISNKQIAYKFWVDPNIPFNLLGDPTRLQQIFNNLFSNAIKFTDLGQITFTVTLKKIETSLATIQFCVADTGIGMSDEELERIFAPFSQASSSTNRFYGGSGLGLNITHQLVKLMEGDISVKSEVKKGTEFYLSIPFQIDAGTEYNRHKDLTFFHNKHALVLTPNTSDQRLLLAALQHWKMEITSFEDINDALPSMPVQGDTHFDICCVDAGMLKQLHHSKKSHLNNFATKLLVFDCNFNESADPLLGLDGIHVLLAPFSLQQMQDTISAILGKTVPIKQAPINSNVTFKPRNELRILIAEDDATNRLVIRAILKKLHIEHEIVANGVLVNERYQQSPSDFDILLMDCEMPEMNGYQATAAIREFEHTHNLKAIPIIALTAHVLPEYEKRCYDSGMNLVIAKPIDINELSKAFDQFAKSSR